MPTISRFFGLIIQMYWDDHFPPHIHVKKGKNAQWVFRIKDCEVIESKGRFTDKDIRLIEAWIELRRSQLMENWELARQKKTLHEIEPIG
jgi:Domain of unknown function (DUF4160)